MDTAWYGTRLPVSPSATTSGMPPTALATTAVSQAIASRLTMPSGSYTDGQTNTVAWVSSWVSSVRGSMSRIQTTPVRVAARCSTAAAVSAAISGVSGAPGAEHQLDVGVELLGRRAAGG